MRGFPFPLFRTFLRPPCPSPSPFPQCDTLEIEQFPTKILKKKALLANSIYLAYMGRGFKTHLPQLHNLLCFFPPSYP